MRLVRIQANGERAPAGLDELAGSGNLDLVQLDYKRPLKAIADGRPVELPDFAAGFVPALAALRKTLYLEPQLRVAASAGWGSSYACVEQAASVLTEGGCGEVVVSAVRGSNVLPILDDLESGGVSLDNADTGAPWRELRQRRAPLLAADLQLGAGPMATALAEGARVVVAGCYDGAAPVIAMAVKAFGWSWTDAAHLAGAAAAARAASWSPWCVSDLATIAASRGATAHPRVELDGSGSFQIELARPCRGADERELAAWLQRPAGESRPQMHADVRLDASRAAITQTGTSQLSVAGVVGRAADRKWQLDVLYQRGFAAEALVELLPEAGLASRWAAEAFKAHFVDAEDAGCTVMVTELAPRESADEAGGWLHVVARSGKFEACQRVADQMAAFVGANEAAVRLPGGAPRASVECGVWPTTLPRDAVDIAIDTRPAREWE